MGNIFAKDFNDNKLLIKFQLTKFYEQYINLFTIYNTFFVLVLEAIDNDRLRHIARVFFHITEIVFVFWRFLNKTLFFLIVPESGLSIPLIRKILIIILVRIKVIYCIVLRSFPGVL
jgi:hypothetical protein